MNSLQNPTLTPLPAQHFLAPMAGISDKAYRVFMSELGAPAVTTELISSEGFVHGSRRTREMMDIDPRENNCGIQIFGHRFHAMAAIAKHAQSIGASFVDINFGCPVQKVTKCGAGSAALKNLTFMRDIIKATRDAIQIPLSIKIRTGWDEEHIVAQEICQLASEEGVDWLSIHGRTREMGYRGPNNWDIISSCHQQASLPIVGNGDIRHAQEALHPIQQHQCSATMIGRAALVDPLIFLRIQNFQNPERIQNFQNSEKIQNFQNPEEPTTQTPHQSIQQLIEHFSSIAQETLHPKVQIVKIKKVAAWLSISRPNSAPFRQHLMRHCHDLISIETAVGQFFRENDKPAAPTNLSFLKGGHG